MAEEDAQSAKIEDLPLPDAEAVDFDLSAENLPDNGNDATGVKGAETGSSDEPEGIFSLFDREFSSTERNPVDPRESSKFDLEFSREFDSMFSAVKGDESAPLFTAQAPLPADSPADSPASATVDRASGSPVSNASDSEFNNSDPLQSESSSPILKENVALPSLHPEDSSPTLPVGRASSTVLPVSSALLSTDDSSLPEPESSLPAPEDSALEAEASRLEDEDSLPTFDSSYDNSEDLEEEFSLLNLDDEDEPLMLADEALPGLDLDDDSMDEEESTEWNSSTNEDESSLEEISFDDSDEEELFDIDFGFSSANEDQDEEVDEDDFESFANLALGFEEDDLEDDAEDDSFKVEELTGAEEHDPFEEIAIMSSDDVANFKPKFGDDELRFEDELPLPEEDDDDPFAMQESKAKPSPKAKPQSSTEEEDLERLDPFSPEAAALAESTRRDSEDTEEPNPEDSDSRDSDREGDSNRPERASRPRGALGKSVLGLLSVPWKLYSALTTVLFGVIETVISILGKIPLIGIPFRALGAVLSAVPMKLKRLIVLAVIAAVAWGGTSVVTNLIPAAGSISLPDSGKAQFQSVELKDGVVTGEIENKGDLRLQLFPEVQLRERQLLKPGTWFKPIELGSCEGPLTPVAIGETVQVSYACEIANDGSVSVKPSLKE